MEMRSPIKTMPQALTPVIADDEYYMRLALKEAACAAAAGEVPIGAVVVNADGVIATGHNRRELDQDPSAHAELLALRSAAQKLGRWRLADCSVYVTLEPCPMCAGLMQQARIKRCVYATADPKAGALGTLYQLHDDQRLNHHFQVSTGVLADESRALLRDFFAQLRTEKTAL
ncbi:MAG: tRNA adenosine(34) deaminase TadA [Coriobacteriia bacterium]|nr:tRNA adenosine(34) deaminase TadA [Coriobacteriia bacterium]